jgi:hypothetical protein
MVFRQCHVDDAACASRKTGHCSSSQLDQLRCCKAPRWDDGQNQWSFEVPYGKKTGERLRVACMSTIDMIAGYPFMDMRAAIA